MNIEITFEEAVFGAKRTVEVPRATLCTECNGSGAKAGTTASQCATCATKLPSFGEMRRRKNPNDRAEVFDESLVRGRRCRERLLVLRQSCGHQRLHLREQFRAALHRVLR